MKVLGVMGSPRVGENSDVLLSQALEGAKAAGADVKKIILARKEIPEPESPSFIPIPEKLLFL